MPPSFAWQALDGQGWPASIEQERMFVADLRRASGDSVSPSTRPAMTVVLNALRCGVPYTDLTQTLPAVAPAQLLASYLELQLALDRAREGWNELVADPTPETVARCADVAALLLPVPVHRLKVAIAHLRGKDALRPAVATVTGEVERVSSQAHAVEDRLARCVRRDPRAIQLGRSLHDVAQPGLWTHPYFLPSRVGELSSTRVRDLRGEERM